MENTNGLEKHVSNAEQRETVENQLSAGQRRNERYDNQAHFDERAIPQMLPQRDPYYPNPRYPDDSYQRRWRSPSPIEEMKEVNSTYDIVKKFQQIQDRRDLLNNVQCRRIAFGLHTPMPLKNGPTNEYNPNYGDSSLIDFADQLATQKYHDNFGILLFILGTIATATWGRVTLKLTQEWIMTTSLMLVQIAPSGSQKSRVISELRKPFDEFQRQFEQGIPSKSERENYERVRNIANKAKNKELLRHFAEEGVTTDSFAAAQDELEKYSLNLKDLDEKMNKVSPTLLTEKTTPRGLTKRLKEQGEAGGCIVAEGEFISRLLLANDCEPSFFNQCYDQEPYSADISSKKIDLRHPYFCMLCFVQRHVLEKLSENEDLKTAGTMARIFPFFHKEKMCHPEKPAFNSKLYDKYSAKIISLLNLYYTQDANAERYEAELTDDALNLVYDYKHKLEQAEAYICEEAKPAFNKLAGQAVRLAWAIHAWNNKIPHASRITVGEVANAIELCRVLEQHIVYLYDPKGLRAYKDAIKIVKSLQRIETAVGNETLAQGYIKSRTLQQRTNIKAKEMLPALELLERHHWVRIIDNGKQSYIVVPHRRITDYNVD